MRFRKIIVFLICIMLIAVVAAGCACSPDPDPDPDPDPGPGPGPGPADYTVTFDVGEHGVAMSSRTFSADNHIDFEDPERKSDDSSKGYAFSGWYANSSFLGSPIYGSSELPGGSNATVYADWQVAKYPVSYTLNGGTAANGAPATYTYFENTTLISATRTGYVFAGWYANNNFTDGPYTVIAAGQEGAKRFYAAWNELQLDEYSITFSLEGGKWTITEYPQSYIEGTEVTLPSPERVGYTFNGWFTARTGGTKVEKIATTDTGNKTFYAQWSITSYSITLNPNGGTLSGTYKQTYTYYDADFFLPTPTKSGVDFGGWCTNENLTGDVVSYIKSYSVGDKVYYAKWLSQTSNPATTTKYEAENVDLTYFVGAGYSGNQTGAAAIVEDQNASGGHYLGWMSDTGLFIDFVINSDRAASGATIKVVVNFEQIKGIYECVDVTLSPENFEVVVSDKTCSYSPTLVKAGDDPNNLFYTTLTISNVDLVAGANIIRLKTLENTLWGGERTAGPGIDYIEVSTTASLNWTPIPNV